MSPAATVSSMGFVGRSGSGGAESGGVRTAARRASPSRASRSARRVSSRASARTGSRRKYRPGARIAATFFTVASTAPRSGGGRFAAVKPAVKAARRAAKVSGLSARSTSVAARSWFAARPEAWRAADAARDASRAAMRSRAARVVRAVARPGSEAPTSPRGSARSRIIRASSSTTTAARDRRPPPSSATRRLTRAARPSAPVSARLGCRRHRSDPATRRARLASDGAEAEEASSREAPRTRSPGTSSAIEANAKAFSATRSVASPVDEIVTDARPGWASRQASIAGVSRTIAAQGFDARGSREKSIAPSAPGISPGAISRDGRRFARAHRGSIAGGRTPSLAPPPHARER